MAETASPPIPLVERFPNSENPHPTVDETTPVGAVGHPDAALEHTPIEHEGKVIGAPQGHNAQIEVPGEKEADELALKANSEEAQRWGAEIAKRKKEKAELPKAA